MIIEGYKTGKTIKEICEEYGVSHSTINCWTKSIQSKKTIVSTKKAKEKANPEVNKEIEN